MNGMSKHTPGPWTIDPDDGGPWYCVREPGGGWIAQVPEPDSADARLIAAAPELLEVLRWAAMFAEGTRDIDRQMSPGRGLDNAGFNGWVDRCNAAIEQATGQEVTS